MDLQHAKILVTGAEGFIGSHLTEALVKMGANVRAFTQYNATSHWGWLEHIESDVIDDIDIFAGDIRASDSVREAMEGYEVVFHLAALIDIPYSYRSPKAFIDTNINGTLNVLQAARDLQIEKLIHTSSSEVYGSAQYTPVNEDHPLRGQSPFAASKIAADQLALSFYHSYDLPVSIIRPFNTYGPRQTTSAIIPTIITQIANGHRTLRLGSTSQTRDFNYIEDIIRGFIAMGESDYSSGLAINIGSGFEVTVEDTAHQIAALMNRSVDIFCDEERLRPLNSEVQQLVADNSKARKHLGWTPHYAGIEGFKRGLRYTINWFSNPENLRHYNADAYFV